MGPAQRLLVDNFHPEPDQRVLLLEGGDGRLAARLAKQLPDGQLLLLTSDARDLRVAAQRLAPIERASTADRVLPAADGAWDVVLLAIPKGRRYARALLLAAWEALRPGGRLFLAGPTQAGAKAVISDAGRLFGNVTTLAYKNRHRVAVATRGASLPDPLPRAFREPGIAPGSVREIEVTCPQGVLTLRTHPALFSWNGLDEGTALLLEQMQVRPGDRVYDFGCGYGVLGLAAALAGASEALMSDVNLLAVRYSRLNAERNGLAEQVRVLAADGLVTDQGQWDLILSNPPFHREHEVDTTVADEMIAQASGILAPAGRLRLVANRFLAYDKRMAQQFKRVERIAETRSFHVLEARSE